MEVIAILQIALCVLGILIYSTLKRPVIIQGLTKKHKHHYIFEVDLTPGEDGWKVVMNANELALMYKLGYSFKQRICPLEDDDYWDTDLESVTERDLFFFFYKDESMLMSQNIIGRPPQTR